MKNKDLKLILDQYKNEHISSKKALLSIEVIYGKKDSSSCSLGRLPKNCSIINYGSNKSCTGCGHFVP
jgi:hypothetical protein